MATLVCLLMIWLDFEVAEAEYASVLNLSSHTAPDMQQTWSATKVIFTWCLWME